MQTSLGYFNKIVNDIQKRRMKLKSCKLFKKL